jgi:hypothetical protein
MLKRDFWFFHGRRCELVIGCSRRLKPESTSRGKQLNSAAKSQ